MRFEIYWWETPYPGCFECVKVFCGLVHLHVDLLQQSGWWGYKYDSSIIICISRLIRLCSAVPLKKRLLDSCFFRWHDCMGILPVLHAADRWKKFYFLSYGICSCRNILWNISKAVACAGYYLCHNSSHSSGSRQFPVLYHVKHCKLEHATSQLLLQPDNISCTCYRIRHQYCLDIMVYPFHTKQ